MKVIDEKFKEVSPSETVAFIKKCLSDIGLRVSDKLVDAGLGHCYSASVFADGGYPSTNGKGVSKEFALASGYAEFMERLQGGRFVLTGMNSEKTPSLYLHTYAPDAKYMTEEEILENGEWMDAIIAQYPGVTREKIAKLCSLYGYTDSGKMLALPFYSIFEKKHVYLPMGFVDNMYTNNGCCAGNTRDEAWVHALSEMIERNCCVKMVSSGEALPVIPDDILSCFPIVSSILEKIKKVGYFDVRIFDSSFGCGFPVITTCVIDKRTSKYLVCVGSDPVLEIAIERTLTEIFQGKTVESFASTHSGQILTSPKDVPVADNIRSQLQSGNALYTVDFFSDEISCNRHVGCFEDNSHCSNSELLYKLLEFYRKKGKPVYVRNYSFLGFNTYKFIVPGFSETRGLTLCDPIQKFYFLLRTAETIKYIEKADNDHLSDFLLVEGIGAETITNSNFFGRLAGIPTVGGLHRWLVNIHRAYAAFRLNDIPRTLKCLERAHNDVFDDEIKSYIRALLYYFDFKQKNIPIEKILSVVKKFCSESAYTRLVNGIEKGNVFEGLLVRCDRHHCEECPLKAYCRLTENEKLIAIVGKEYAKFTDGQKSSIFDI